MKVTTNPDTCIAAGQCSQAAPNVFRNREEDGTVELLTEHPAGPDQDGAREAETLCPSASITVEEDQ